MFEDQFYTLANVFELDTSSASYSSTWAPTGSPTPVPTPGPTPVPTTAMPTASQAPTASFANITTKFVSSSNLDNTDTDTGSRRRRLALEEAGGLSASARKLLVTDNNYAMYTYASHQNITSYKVCFGVLLSATYVMNSLSVGLAEH